MRTFSRNILRIFGILYVWRPPPRLTTKMDTPPKRKRGAELSLGRRYAMAVEIALTIPPGNERAPKGALAPIAARHQSILFFAPQVSCF